MLETFFEEIDMESLVTAINETFYMTIFALLGTFIIGIVLGA